MRLVPRLAWWAALAALTELVLLRIATRTFVHIPGLDVVAGPLSVVAEAGRLAFYLTVVLLTALLVATLSSLVKETGPSRRMLMGGVGVILLSSFLAFVGGASPTMTGWMSLIAIGLVAFAAVTTGWRAVSLVLWATALALIATGALLQGSGGGLEGGEVGGLLLAGDLVSVAAATTLPLLLGSRPSLKALTAGLVAMSVIAAALWTASSTISILVLWSFGIPAALPPLLYGVGAGAAVATVWSAVERGRTPLAAAVVLLSAGGFSLISTYQTTLVVAGLALAVMDLAGSSRPIDEVGTAPSEGQSAGSVLDLNPPKRARALTSRVGDQAVSGIRRASPFR